MVCWRRRSVTDTGFLYCTYTFLVFDTPLSFPDYLQGSLWGVYFSKMGCTTHQRIMKNRGSCKVSKIMLDELQRWRMKKYRHHTALETRLQIPVVVLVVYGSEPSRNPEWDPKFWRSGLISGQFFFNLKATLFKLPRISASLWGATVQKR
jgi:hypothetical protein